MSAQKGPANEDNSAGVVMLEGQALLERARSLSNRPEDQIARACGYVGPSGRVLKKNFYRALVDASAPATISDLKQLSSTGISLMASGLCSTESSICFEALSRQLLARMAISVHTGHN